MADMDTQLVGTDDFSHGLVTVLPPHLIPDGASPLMQDVDLSENVGSVTKRLGQTQYMSPQTVGANPWVSGLHDFVTSSGGVYLLVSANTDVYNVTGSGTYTSIFNAAMAGSDVNFVTFADLAIIVNPNITTQKWTGSGSTSALLGTPPSNVNYVCVHKSRVWMANTSAGASRLHYSSLATPEDWTSSGDSGAGFIDINPNDGDHITGITPCGNALIIFKQRSVFALYGNVPSQFLLRPLSTSVGCIAPKSIAGADNVVFFLSYLGLYVATENNISFVSYNIKPTLEQLSVAAKKIACGGKYRTNYWLCYDSNADGVNDSAYVFDYVHGLFFSYSNIRANRFVVRADNSFITGGSDQVKVRQMESGTSDEGTAITGFWQS